MQGLRESLCGRATSISSEIRGNQIILFGTLANRSVAGINPKINNILPRNVGKLSSMSTSAWSSITPGWTWASIAVSGVADTAILANGNYTVSEYDAALSFDVASGLSGLTSAVIGRAAAGLATGSAVGTTGGMEIGAAPGLVAGAIFGGVVGAISYANANNYKDEYIDFASPGIEIALLANSTPNPYAGIGFP
jgi:hypothetical protein